MAKWSHKLRFIIAGFPIIVGLGSAPASAQNKQSYTSVPDNVLMQDFDKGINSPTPDYCGQLASIINELADRRASSSKLPYLKAYIDFQCAYVQQRWKDAYALVPTMERESGQTIPDSGRYILAVLAEEYVAGAKNVISMTKETDSRALTSMDGQLFFYLSRGLYKNNEKNLRAELMRALVDSAHWPKLNTELRSSVAEAVIKIDGEQGTDSRLTRLIYELQGPYPYRSMLADRKLQLIWPQLEKAAGPNMRIAIEKYVADTQARYQADRLDRKAFQQAVHALHFAGRFEDAITLARTYDHSPAAMEKLTEDDAWALDIEAYSLDALGRRAEAEAIYDQIAAIPYVKGKNGWLVSFVINRSSRLVRHGQMQKGLEAAALARKIAWEYGSPYARMLVRKAEVCALHKLGRGAETGKLLDELYAEREEAYGAATQSFLCVGGDDKAAAIALEALNRPDAIDKIADEFLKPEFELFYTGSVLPDIRERLIGRPDIAEALSAITRDIPADFVPLVGKRRAELAKER